jgi:polyisoprenoid-binding protein YceI
MPEGAREDLMLRRTFFVLALGLLAPAAADASPKSRDPAQVPAGNYELDPRHASLIVRVPHMGGFSRYTMRFNALSGRFTYDPADWKDTQVTITVDPKSIDTGDEKFDKTIAGTFLDADKYPVIEFVSTGLTPETDGRGQLTGDLKFHGVTKPVTLEVAFNGVGPGLLGGGTRLGFSGAGAFQRSDFGANAVRAFAGDRVELEFDVEFVKK